MKAVQARLQSTTHSKEGDGASVALDGVGAGRNLGSRSSSGSSSRGAGVQQAEQKPPQVCYSCYTQACAVKLGDDVNMSKAQVDPRLPADVQEEVKQQVVEMARRTQTVTAAEHGAALSKVLREAYVAVTEQGCLQHR
jgi:hypothetical protein